MILDGSVPGEGEHKIMEFIRLQRLQPGYEPNTRHCLHGLDADLIMLSLATHEPHFTILREYVGPAGKRAGPGSLTDVVEAELTKAAEAEADGGAAKEAEKAAAGPTPFQFLHVRILREYLCKEFCQADYSAEGGFDLERLLDDFVFMCFFVGNDFLPHLPSLDIREGGIDTLFDLYKSGFNDRGGWICDGGKVDLERARLFCVELGKLEDELLARKREKFARKKRDAEGRALLEGRHRSMQQRGAETAQAPRASAHLQALRGKQDTNDREMRRQALGESDATLLELFDTIQRFAGLPDSAKPVPLPSGLTGFQRAMAHQYCDELCVANESRGEEPNRSLTLYKKNDANESAANKFKRELGELLKTKNTLPETQDSIMLGVPGWKDRYYKQKMPENDDDEGRQAVARSYVEGLCWVMRYYYDGCQSWKWFFPYHYAPFAADIANAITPAASGGDEVVLEAGAPFAPFQQLMAVLPPRSSHALPAPFAELMTDPSSEIGDFYPTDFAIDINGKKFAWQAVVLLPFIDEERLLDALETREDELSEDEKRRNSHGVCVRREARCGRSPRSRRRTARHPRARRRGAASAVPSPRRRARRRRRDVRRLDFRGRRVRGTSTQEPRGLRKVRCRREKHDLPARRRRAADAPGEFEGRPWAVHAAARPLRPLRCRAHGARRVGGGGGDSYRRDTESDGGAPLPTSRACSR